MSYRMVKCMKIRIKGGEEMWYKISKKDLKLGEKFIFYFYCLCIIFLF